MPTASSSQPHRRLEAAVEPAFDLAAQARDALRQLIGPAGRLAEPEGNGGRLAVGVLHPDRALLHAQDAIGGVAQLEDIALQALHGEVLVDRADGLRLRFEQHRVVGRVGYRPAGGQGRQTRAAPAAHFAVDGVVVDEGAATAAARSEAVCEHPDDIVELRALQVAVGVGALQQGEELIEVPLARGDFGHDLLRQHIERLGGNAQAIELPAPDAVEQRRAFDEIVARQREKPAFGRAAQAVTGASDALQQGCDGPRRAELTDQIHVTDVDAELERCGRDESLELAALQARLRREAQLLRQAAVVRRDQRLAHTLR